MVTKLTIRTILQTILGIVFAVAIFSPPSVAQPGGSFSPGGDIRDTTRILFIGNSYTYFNNLPEIIAGLAKAGEIGHVEYRIVVGPGWRLKDHWEKGEARQILHQNRWDYAILQEQSTLGVYYVLEGKDRISTDSLFRVYAGKWAVEIRESGVVPVFYLTWARKWAPEDQELLNRAYISAARETQSALVPVGIAWAYLRETDPEFELFCEDGSHPNQAGSYLAACTFYATIFGENPVGLPGEIYGAPFDSEMGKVDSAKKALLVDLNEDQACLLQMASWVAVQSLMPTVNYPEVATVTTATLAPLPVGIPLQPELLEGSWHGRIMFFDLSGPAEMGLYIDRQQKAYRARLELRYNSEDLTDENIYISDIVVGERELAFTAPKSAGVEGLDIRFRAVIADNGEMRGIAEAAADDADPQIRYLGSWMLTRKQ